MDRIDLADEISLPIYDGWYLSTDSIDYPFQVINNDKNSELLIFKSTISGEGLISNEQELKIAVDQVIKDVILSLPDAVLLTNTGIRENNRVCFTFDFLSTDTINFIELKHRLKGILYRHPDNYQILFTLWAKTALAGNNNLTVLSEMQENFSYYGEAEPDFFYRTTSYGWTWGTLLVVIIVLIMIFYKKRIKNDRVEFSDETNFWRCNCGRLNHNQYKTCRRCGKLQETEIIT